jgi:predicted ATP-grasp superfamily ATP-dependent carboligase
MSLRILVTDGEQRAALAVTRSLGRAGHLVHVAGLRRRPLAGASRYCRRTVLLPDPLHHSIPYADAVREHVRRERIDLIVPITEATILALLPQREHIDALIPLPPAPIVSRVLDKDFVLRTAQRLGIAVPNGLVLDRPGEADRLSAPWFPAVLKPSRSVQQAPDGTKEKAAVCHVADQDQLRRALDALPASAYPLLLQERIGGEGRGVFLLRWGGRTLAAFAHRRLREKPPAGGVSVYSESIALEPDLLRSAERLLDALEWEGVAMVEFKREPDSGRNVLMEINGRFWGSLQLAVDAGVDFPALLVAAASGEAAVPTLTYRIGARCRWWWGDMDHLITRARRSAASLHLPPGSPGRLRTAVDILVPWRSPGRNEVLRWGDPMPALRESFQWLRGLR